MKRLTTQEIMELYPMLRTAAPFIGITQLIDKEDIRKMMRPRSPFAHKGTMGHALLVSGRYGMAGATILAAKGCMRSGAGKLTIHTAKKNNDILQTTIPEAIISHDTCDTHITESIQTAPYNAIAIGPGLGTDEQTAKVLHEFIKEYDGKLVIDADGINILSIHPEWMKNLPQGTILTPHLKELERLTGESSHFDESVGKALNMAVKYGIYIVIKGHHSIICSPQREIFINPTGNAGMATAGSGDVLTGIVLGLLARGYNAQEACLMGVFLHGYAGDIAAEQLGMESMMASDIFTYLPMAFKKIEQPYEI